MSINNKVFNVLTDDRHTLGSLVELEVNPLVYQHEESNSYRLLRGRGNDNGTTRHCKRYKLIIHIFAMCFCVLAVLGN
jgi:hypothetical protein